MARKLVALIPFFLLAWTYAAVAQEQVFHMDPGQSHVDFTLGDVLHTVHGTFKLSSGELRFDSKTGQASGQLVVDAASGDSGNGSRDKKMKREILETDKYPTIVFTPEKVVGNVAPGAASQVQLAGSMMLHGQAHPMTLVVPVRVNGSNASADVHFTVPYVAWGLKNPSTLFLRVDKQVDIVVHAVGTLSTETAQAQGSH